VSIHSGFPQHLWVPIIPSLCSLFAKQHLESFSIIFSNFCLHGQHDFVILCIVGLAANCVSQSTKNGIKYAKKYIIYLFIITPYGRTAHSHLCSVSESAGRITAFAFSDPLCQLSCAYLQNSRST